MGNFLYYADALSRLNSDQAVGSSQRAKVSEELGLISNNRTVSLTLFTVKTEGEARSQGV